MLRMMSRKCYFGAAISKMLGHPPNWRFNMIAGPRSAGRPLGGLDLRYAAGAGL